MSAAFRQQIQLRDVWEAARTERNFDYVFWADATIDIIVNNALQHFGYCLVFFASLLISTLVTAGFFIVLPAVTTPGSLWHIFNSFVGKPIANCNYDGLFYHTHCYMIMYRLVYCV
jgi:hypothetical protein